MKSETPEQGELLARVRQQLILAQVRIMELEDARDELQARLSDSDTLRQSAQTIADRKIEESAHFQQIHRDLQAQYEHMRHMQHVTNEALNECRQKLAETEAARTAASAVAADLKLKLDDLQKQAADLQRQLTESVALAAARNDRIAGLDAEIRGLRSSRSWRWTAWLRSLERTLGRNKA